MNSPQKVATVHYLNRLGQHGVQEGVLGNLLAREPGTEVKLVKVYSLWGESTKSRPIKSVSVKTGHMHPGRHMTFYCCESTRIWILAKTDFGPEIHLTVIMH